MTYKLIAATVVIIMLSFSVSYALPNQPPANAAAGRSGSDKYCHEAAIDASDRMDYRVIQKKLPTAPKEAMNLDDKPSKTAVWIKGYWRWNHSKKQYAWVPGIWREPPPGLTWNQGCWKKVKKGLVWIPGHWGKPGKKNLSVMTDAPPPLKKESIPRRPDKNHTWIGGYWKDTPSGYSWVPGKWKKPPKSAQVWVKGCWVKRPEGYVYVAGHWDLAQKKRIKTKLSKKSAKPVKKAPASSKKQKKSSKKRIH